ncbi:hypothetical protein TWF106_008935 [Orbilia oligospora]|uniref:Glycosyltransferase family 69 protein n=1 Tax=Orbilia oligospora TaxID=2813651 RepID=A0A6G1M0S7_ORBOL|nr:hypothetical protein TWF106_008935 [Orbilia oligospora]KAF3215210.1 hypothetical protein TWF679_004452 [Orbilia oligospora]KAF3218857.1 hypothetical protein TWF191_008062 [Orbilia oligospora]KAF3240212.1 hypothetical protein TWF192_009535 [Orbilia oligospora]
MFRTPISIHSTIRRWWGYYRSILGGYHEYAILILLPALYFRFSYPIFTHNSATLSLYLATVFFFLPIKTAAALWGLVACGRDNRNHYGKSRYSTGLLATPLKRKSPWRVPAWILSGIFVIWTYAYGTASPFPEASELVSDPVFLEHQKSNASYFIAASFWNNEPVLDHWTREMTSLIEVLGPQNVYLSLTENDSEDNTASKLLHYARKLTKMQVQHSLNITRELRGYPSNMPWENIPHRMAYMANLRNGALQPLYENNTPFRTLVLMNDVVFHHTDVLKLIIASNGKTMACSVDMDGATLYDQWVLRDSCGRATTGFWPFFMDSKDRAVVRRGGVLDVGTCWNGIVALDADPFLNTTLRREGSWNGDPLRFPQPPGCIISECALLPLTLINQTSDPIVVMDSSVVVAYTVHWWNYYAVWLRMPVVRLWMRVFEEWWWGAWWIFFGDGLKWIGLDDGKEMGECVVEGWPECGSKATWKKGSVRLKKKQTTE